jgi:hypothetical protein
MHSSPRDGTKIIWLAVHTTEGIMRAADLRDWTSWKGSSHASSDETGALLTPDDGFVPYDREAWTLRAGNQLSENIEQCARARYTRTEWLAREKLLDATARWLADRSKARGIPLVHLTLDEVRAHKPGVIGHADYTYATGDGTHTDPGPEYPWDVVLDKARAYAKPPEADIMATKDELRDIVREELDKDHEEAATRVRQILTDGSKDWSLSHLRDVVKASDTRLVSVERKLDELLAKLSAKP